MLARLNRVDKQTFEESWRKTKAFHADFGTIRYSRGAVFRATCIVSKKVAAGSPDRHRIKRRIYALLQSEAPKLPTGVYLVYPKKSCLTTTAPSLAREVSVVLDQIRRYAA